jgi:uncharacterized protein YjaZ
MQITPIDALGGLRAALTAPAAERDALFGDRLVAPLRPFWEGWIRFMGPRKPAEEVTPLDVARTFSFYHPALGAERGLAALDTLERAGAWPEAVRALERAAAVLDPAGHGVDLPEVRFTFVLADPDRMDPRTGLYTGAGNTPGCVLLLAWPTTFNVPRLPAIVTHELNHNVRFRVEPWSPATTVGKYLVDEGVAECFAAELHGEALLGPWTLGLHGAALEALRPRYREALDVIGFDEIRGYIFGDWAAEQTGYRKQGLPDFAGYAFGYRMVRAFLDRTGMSAAEATYLPWREIVDGSGWL